jgi:hypothetical protein
MSMDIVDGRILPVIDVGMSPALMWDESVVSADGAALACPLCGWAKLHLDMVHFAMPVGMYEPTIGVDIDTAARVVMFPGEASMVLHGAKSRGPMLAVGYWCEAGCRGRIELRQHKGSLFLSLVEEPGFLPEDMVTSMPSASDRAAVAEHPETTVPF